MGGSVHPNIGETEDGWSNLMGERNEFVVSTYPTRCAVVKTKAQATRELLRIPGRVGRRL